MRGFYIQLLYLLFTKCSTAVLLRSAVPQWMKEQGIFVAFIYSYYANYDDCGTAVAAFENTYKWPGILKFSLKIITSLREPHRGLLGIVTTVRSQIFCSTGSV